jgi:hypothetical protein
MALIDEVRLLMPWLPEHLVQLYVDAYVEFGNEQLAWAQVRQSDEYDTWVPGNRRDDGSLRMSEGEYFATVEGYHDLFRSVGVNPDLFANNIVRAIEGNMSVREFQQERFDPLVSRILLQGPALREHFSRYNQLDLTTEALIAMALSPEIERNILDKKITVAEIGAEASYQGFDIRAPFAQELFRRGLDRSGAADVFESAGQQIPVLSVLAARHADPDDEFDLYDFTNAVVFDDPEQRRRIRRLIAQETSMFANVGAQTGYKQSGFQGAGGFRQITGLESV